ncbi:hypothetical protein PIB30_062044 [Stylosanthes scabra]|uniref:Uncharacterized protein n=1 Tax=Stylosanthes scabra TaxID=79078 RepID=A0ABU6QKF8_9FABA|nr:hypothetical protein [Stylosanthes scabra]
MIKSSERRQPRYTSIVHVSASPPGSYHYLVDDDLERDDVRGEVGAGKGCCRRRRYDGRWWPEMKMDG